MQEPVTPASIRLGSFETIHNVEARHPEKVIGIQY
jgi:hypothetical protein